MPKATQQTPKSNTNEAANMPSSGPSAPPLYLYFHQKLSYFFLIFVCFALATFDVTAADSIRQRLVSAVASQNIEQTVIALNEAKQTPNETDLTSTIRALWDEGRNTKRGPPSDFARAELVRINVADFLVQAYRNGKVSDLDRGEIHEFVRALAKSSRDSQARGTAFIVLGIVDDPKDVADLEQLVLHADASLPSVVAALGVMCNDSAHAALVRLDMSINSKPDKALLRSALVMHSATKQSGVGWCNRRVFMEGK